MIQRTPNIFQNHLIWGARIYLFCFLLSLRVIALISRFYARFLLSYSECWFLLLTSSEIVLIILAATTILLRLENTYSLLEFFTHLGGTHPFSNLLCLPQDSFYCNSLNIFLLPSPPTSFWSLLTTIHSDCSQMYDSLPSWSWTVNFSTQLSAGHMDQKYLHTLL